MKRKDLQFLVRIFLCGMLLLLLVESCVLIYFWCRQWRFQRRLRAQSTQPGGIGRHVVRKIPTVEYRNTTAAGEDVECPICHVEYRGRDKLRVLCGCGHKFHVSCVDSWLARNDTCPVCRNNVRDAVAEAAANRVVEGLPECGVCFSEYDDGDMVKIIPGCNHRFHDSCIDLWLSSNNNTCPLCSRTVDSRNRSTWPVIAAASVVPTAVSGDQGSNSRDVEALT